MELILINAARRVAGPFLRISLAVILVWIAALKFVVPSLVVGLLQASLAFLAFNAFVYVVGIVEIVVAILLVTGIALPFAALVTVGPFCGDPDDLRHGAVGYQLSRSLGQFLLKDLGLMAAAVKVIAMAPVREPASVMRPSVPFEIK